MMLDNCGRLVKGAFIVAVCYSIVLAVGFLSISPVAFQKLVTVASSKEPTLVPPTSISRYPDIRALIAPIPYKKGILVSDVFPPDRFHKTIEMGQGNCSNLVFGMAFYLNQHGYDYQAIHIMPYRNFLRGSGHSVLNMPYEFEGAPHVGVVDLLGGGLPKADGRLLDIETLKRKHLPNPSIVSLNALNEDASIYYGDFVNNAALGIVESKDVKIYFDFLQKIYVPLGNKNLERILYSSLGVVAGFYPTTYVSVEDYAKLFNDKKPLVWAAKALLWLMRLLPLILVALIALRVQALILSLHPIRSPLTESNKNDALA